MFPERHDGHDEVLDDIYPLVTIGDLNFYPSDILYSCDPIAYRISVSEYIDNYESDEDN